MKHHTKFHQNISNSADTESCGCLGNGKSLSIFMFHTEIIINLGESVPERTDHDSK